MPGYTYPSSDTLKNKLGATTHDELEHLEGPLVGFRRAEVEAGRGPAGEFDAAHLKELHRFLFQDVFEWAGHTRDERVRLSDGDVAIEPVMRKIGGKPFLAGGRIARTLERIAANEGRRPGMMRRLFKDAVLPGRREPLAKAIASLETSGFAWNERYIAAAEPRHSVDLTLAGVAGAEFMGRTSNAIIVGRSADLPSPVPASGETFTLKPRAWPALG